MRMIEQEVHEFKETPTDFDGCLRLIERAARTCYGSAPSEDIERTRRFLEGLIDFGHLSVLRHSNLIRKYRSEKGPYFNVVRQMIGGNYQSWIEWAFGNKAWSPVQGTRMTPTKKLDWVAGRHEEVDGVPPELKRYTAHITTSLRNSHQLVRHTTLAVSQKSTRYIDHSDLEVIKPWWMDNSKMEDGSLFVSAMQKAEAFYNELLCEGVSKEDAADVLPKATATELWVTGDRDAWLNVKAQRLDNSTGKASKQMQELCKLIDWEIIE